MLVGLEQASLFAGRYRILRRISAGGMGEVYECVHVETNRRRALKVMHAHIFQNDDMRERFKREARIAAEIESEHIVDVFDAGVDDATEMPFLVMELLRGEDLSQRVKRMGRLPSADVITYMRQIAAALEKTHAASIVHRDLKPENLFLTKRDDGSPRLKILDFGVAKVVAEGVSGASGTQSLGTPLYMPPEQFRAEKRLTPAVDIYALGMVVYTLLVGEAYWRTELRALGDLLAFVVVVLDGPKESAVRRAAGHGVILPPAFDVWFSRATAVDPAARFAGVQEMVGSLERSFQGAASVDATVTVPLPSVESRGETTGESSLESMPSPLGEPRAGSTPQHADEISRAVSSGVRRAQRKPSRALLIAAGAGLVVALVGGRIWIADRKSGPRGSSIGDDGAGPSSQEQTPGIVSAAMTTRPAVLPVVDPTVSGAALVVPAMSASVPAVPPQALTARPSPGATVNASPARPPRPAATASSTPQFGRD